MSDIEEFRNDIIVAEAAELGGDYRIRASLEKICEQLGRGDVVDDLVPCSWRGKGAGGRVLGVDAASIQGSDGSIVLLLYAFDGSLGEPGVMPQADVVRHFRSLSGFLEAALAGGLVGKLKENHPEEELRAEIHQRNRAITKARLILATDMKLGERVRELPGETIQGVPCEFHVWDISRLAELSRKEREPLDINLASEFSSPIPCLPAHLPTDDYQSYLCVVPASLLADLYGRWGTRLLETNVRGFLSERGKVNRGIRATIQNRPHMFFAYNNGLTATAAHVEVASAHGECRITRARDLQIVNGGQTTASLFWARKKYGTPLDGVRVQMKLSVVPESMADHFDEIVSDISRFANSQNKVSDADLFSNHPFHREMEKISKRAGIAPKGGGNVQSYWFYERARAQYENERAPLKGKLKADFDRKYPKTQLITKTDFAKYANCVDEAPHIVSEGAQKSFRFFAESISGRWEKNPSQFNEAYYKRHVGVAIVYKALEALISREPWYEGYRINIIAYTIALLVHHGLRRGKRLNLLALWQQQAIAEAAAVGLVSLAAQTWKCLPAVERRSQRPQWGNLGQWFKAKECWEEAKLLPVDLAPALGELMISEAKWDAQSDAGQKSKAVDDQIDAQVEVIRLREEGFWRRLRDWNAEDPVLSQQELDAVVKITSMGPNFVPKGYECSALISARQRAQTNGFE